MKIVKKIMAAVFVLMALLVIGSAENVSAKQINSAGAAQKAALKKVGSSATVIEVDMDMERGVLFYDVELLKKNKTYTLKYNSKTGALSEYGWEINIKPYSGQSGKLISRSSIQKKALKKVKKAKVLSIHNDYDDGISEYDIKLQKGTKRYELVYNAASGKLLEYKWEIVSTKASASNKYISAEKAKSIAQKKAPGATVVKVEYDNDDGMQVYDVSMVEGMYEYDVTIDAKTGQVIEFDKDFND